jgi:hypothetical protein
MYERTITRRPMAAVVDLNQTGEQEPRTKIVYIETEKKESVIRITSSLMFFVMAAPKVLGLNA